MLYIIQVCFLSSSLFLCFLFICHPHLVRVLLQCGVDVDSRDIDGWTPLHAAAHWGQEEVCTLLADNMCDMGAVSNVVSCIRTSFPSSPKSVTGASARATADGTLTVLLGPNTSRCCRWEPGGRSGGATEETECCELASTQALRLCHLLR